MLAPSSTSKRDRPKGLWKARVTAPHASARRRIRERQPRNSGSGSDHDDDREGSDSNTSTDSKKQRRYPLSNNTDDDEVYYWDYSRRCSPYPDRASSWATRARIMDTSTTAGGGSQPRGATFDYEDWEDLKELFAKATEQYESDDAAEALPIIRGVIHECHRFLLFYQDPSVLFANPPSHHSHSPDTLAPPGQRLKRDWADEPLAGVLPYTSQPIAPQQPQKELKCTCSELPTAFHAILGTALFFFGNLIGQEPSLALPGEPDNPAPYWLAALDVFETGENLPCRTDGRSPNFLPEDWRMAIVWGRTLVCIADETVTRALKARQSQPGSAAELLSPVAGFSADEPDWPIESPFSAIAALRPPITRRMSLSTASPHELMVLAMDQFSRGIFHMPHPQHARSHFHRAPPTARGAACPPSVHESFSRAKELFTVASEVLLLSEKLEIASERRYWALWADSVFNQMKMEADMDAWRGPITRARGRCWLIVGSARVEELEMALERGEMDVLQTEEAQEAREGLSKAIDFFDRAKNSVTMSASSDLESHELQPLLAEALLTLANLTADVVKREELYARAQLESADDFNLGDGDEDETMDEGD